MSTPLKEMLSKGKECYKTIVVVVVMGHGSNPLVGRPLVGLSLKPKGVGIFVTPLLPKKVL